MKNLILVTTLLLSIGSFAEEKKDQPSSPTTSLPKMTTKDAKKICKEKGVTGADLIQCLKDQKEEK